MFRKMRSELIASAAGTSRCSGRRHHGELGLCVCGVWGFTLPVGSVCVCSSSGGRVTVQHRGLKPCFKKIPNQIIIKDEACHDNLRHANEALWMEDATCGSVARVLETNTGNPIYPNPIHRMNLKH